MRIILDSLPPKELRGNARLSTGFEQRWAVRRKAKDEFLGWLFVALQPYFLKPRVMLHKVVADVVFVVPDKRHRDIENFIMAMKCIWDELVLMEYLEADDYEHFSYGKISFEVNKEEAPKTIIELR